MKPTPAPTFTEQLSAALLKAVTERDGRLAFSVEEAGRMIGLGKTKSYDLVARGILPSVSIDGARRVTLSQLLGYLSDLEKNERRAA